MRDIDIYSSGLCHCSVCVPEEMPMDEAIAMVNQRNPTGINSQWQLSEDKEFADGDPNPKVCEADPTRRHYLMVC